VVQQADLLIQARHRALHEQARGDLVLGQESAVPGDQHRADFPAVTSMLVA
jgi:hypothetical protein